MFRNFIFIAALLPSIATAQSKIDTTTPQLQMHARISAVVDRRAKELGLSQDVVTYCRVELNRRTDEFPKNGSIPFGIHYDEITDRAQLDQVISAREAYEKVFMLSCLAHTKRQLDGSD